MWSFSSHRIVLPSDLRSLMYSSLLSGTDVLRDRALVTTCAFIHTLSSENDSIPRTLLGVGTRTLCFRHHGAFAAAQVASLLLRPPASTASLSLSRCQWVVTGGSDGGLGEYMLQLWEPEPANGCPLPTGLPWILTPTLPVHSVHRPPRSRQQRLSGN